MNLNFTILFGIVTVAIGFGTGWHAANLKCTAKEAIVQEEARKKYDELASQYYAASATLEALSTARRSKQADTDKALSGITSGPAYDGDCLDADGVRILNDAIRGGSSSPAKPAG